MNTLLSRSLSPAALLRSAFAREKRWHTLWLVFSWACLLFACARTWQVIQGRMYYLLDSDMSSDLLWAMCCARNTPC